MTKKQFPKDSEGLENDKLKSENEISSQSKRIPKELRQVLKDIPEPKREEVLKRVFQYLSIKQFAGPIPPPEILHGYNDCINNGAERVIAMAEKQSNHRIQIEDHVIKEQLKQSRRGQDYGFVTGIICIIATVVLALTGHETVASIVGGSTILGLVTVFVVGKKKQKKETDN